MATTYRIRGWIAHFECAESRKLKHLPWVRVPTKHDGKSLRRVMRLPNGAQIFGAWVLIVQVAAKCPVRGTLADHDGPLTPDDLEIKTGCPADVFEYALKVLSSKEIGWIEADASEESPNVPGESPGSPPASPDVHGESADRGEERRKEEIRLDKTAASAAVGVEPSPVSLPASDEPPAPEEDRFLFERETTEPASPPDPPVLSFPTIDRANDFVLLQSKLDEYQATYIGIDVLAFLRHLRQWCVDNPHKRKTLKRFSAWLTARLGEEQNRHGGRFAITTNAPRAGPPQSAQQTGASKWLANRQAAREGQGNDG